MPAADQIPENVASSDRLPLLDNGKPQTASQTSAHRGPRRFLQIIALLALIFFGAVMGLYFQGPALRAFFKWSPLEPGAGARQPIAVSVDRVPSPERVAAMAKGAVVALGRLQPSGGIVSVALPAGAGDATVERLLVAEGDLVSEGDLLAVLDSIAQYEAALTSAESTLAIKQAALAQTIVKVETAEAELRAQLRIAAVTLAAAESELARMQTLFDRGTTTQAVLEDAQLAADTSRADIARLQASLTQYQPGSQGVQVDIAVATADLAAAEAAVAQAKKDLDRARVFAPQNGRIIDVAVRAGERVTSDGLLRMGDTERMEVEVEVFQTMVPRVAVGQPVSITSGVLGEAPLTGTVSRIGILVGRQDVTADDPAANTDARVLEINVELDTESSARAAKFVNLEVVARIDVVPEGEDAGDGK